MDNTAKSGEGVSMRMLIGVFVGTSLIAGSIIFAVLYWFFLPQATPLPLPYVEGNPDGVRELREPRAVVDFTLPSTLGRDVSISDFEGKMTLLFFGYTHCPDVCLTTVADVRQVADLLGDDADAVAMLFISVDGERDTPERMLEFFTPFGVTDYAIGLQGDDLTLQRIRADYSLFYQLNTDEGDNYSVDHSASMYLLNADGELDTIFAYGTRPNVIAAEIRAQLDES